MADTTEAFHRPSTFGAGWDGSALRLRLGGVVIEHRPIEAQLRDAMRLRLVEAEQRNPRRRWLRRSKGERV